jgi:hypothetical protein
MMKPLDSEEEPPRIGVVTRSMSKFNPIPREQTMSEKTNAFSDLRNGKVPIHLGISQSGQQAWNVNEQWKQELVRLVILQMLS